jgi:hypothetical protein
MNRFRFTDADINRTIQYLKTGKGHLEIPRWAEKYQEDLKIKTKQLYYKDKLIVSREKLDGYLRKRLYDKKADLTTGRDSLHYQLMKEIVGAPRRMIMEFLRKQKSYGETRSALPQPKQTGGPRLKGFVVETDLCFIKKADLVACNPRFEKTQKDDLVYCVTSVEKSSGLTKLDYVKTKRPEIVTPIVIEHLKYFAQRNGNKTTDYELWSDKGGEFDHKKIKPHVKETKFVSAGKSCENRNRLFQQCFYRILKNRQSVSVKNAIKKSQDQINNTFSKIHRKTPNEVVDNKIDTLKQYNKTRKQHISNMKRKPLEIGDYVRVQIKGIKSKLGFKSYKNETFTTRVYKIEGRTKKLPHKYYIKSDKRKWYLADSLLKSAPRDEKSLKLIEERDEEQKTDDRAEKERSDAERKKQQIEDDKRIAALKKAGKLGTRQDAAKKLRAKMKARQTDEEFEKMLEDDQKEYEKEQKAKGKVLRKKKRANVFQQKWGREGEEEWVPGQKVKRKNKGGSQTGEFLNLVDWTEGEQDKVYAGKPNAQALTNKYNKNIMRGKELATQLRKNRVKLKGYSVNYFNQYQL